MTNEAHGTWDEKMSLPLSGMGVGACFSSACAGECVGDCAGDCHTNVNNIVVIKLSFAPCDPGLLTVGALMKDGWMIQSSMV